MEFRILGPLEAWADGEPVDLGPHRQRALLALLVMSVDRVVPTDRILDALWGEAADGKENALWVHISRLRSALEPGRAERGQSSVLLTRDHGYTIRSDPDTVDAHRFEAAVSEARRRIALDPDTAAAMLREALGLWHGSPLQDFTYEEFARDEIARLEQLRVEAIELRVEADLKRGLDSELITELDSLVHKQPLRERPVLQLMLALYRAGRQADALRAFQRYRNRLGDELGVEPSPELCRLEEQILLHDERLTAPVRRSESRPAGANPFKGLYAFQESDADNFFGRDRLVVDVLTRLQGRGRMVALVGPSGSGKSSVVRAGLVPALRKGGLPGSDEWLIASMVPGAHPFAELEAGLLRATVDGPASLDAQLADPTLGVLRAALRVLPDEGTRLVLVIDQFEELFTLVDDEGERQRFLANLVAALEDPQGRVMVVLTLRADAYHRPLAYADFAARLGPALVNVLALTTDELEEAALAPAEHCDVSFEPALLAELLSDVIGEPGALPMFQFALTELFDQREGGRLTLASYRTMGGARAVLSRRAEDVYHGLTPEEQEAARQLFLRLVTITEQEHWSRRRVPASEVVAVDVDVVTMESVIDQLCRQRFLALDRDPVSGAPTVEVAHEALLVEWQRLHCWIDEGRADIARRSTLDAALLDWKQTGRDLDYLLTGKRLAEYERWRDTTTMRLTTAERDYIDESVIQRDEDASIESARTAREAGLARKARRGWWTLVAVVVAVATTAAAVFAFGRSESPSVAMIVLSGGGGTIDGLMIAGLERAGRDFDFEPIVIQGPFTNLETEIESLARSDIDLVMFADSILLNDAVNAAALYPDVAWAFIDTPFDGHPSVTFAEHEGSYLAGAAAALTSETGTVGFVGGFQFSATERFRAGFEAGARAVNPGIEVLATYVATDAGGFLRTDLVHQAAVDMFEQDADVVLHAAGSAGDGVFTAAREQSAKLGRHLWGIGADADQYLGADELDRPYVLTSTIKRFDVATYELVADYLDGGLEPGQHELTLSDGAVGYSTSGGHLSAAVEQRLRTLRDEIVAGERGVPRAPSGGLSPPLGDAVDDEATVTFDGGTCNYDGPTQPDESRLLHVRFVNESQSTGVMRIGSPDGSTMVQVPAEAGSVNEGYATLDPGRHTVTCQLFSDAVDGASIEGTTLSVAAVTSDPT